MIVGGGDGGTAREVSKHPDVERVILVDIDDRVIEVCKQHLPNLSLGLNNPKVNISVGDGFEFLKTHRGEFDVIITDSSDPVGKYCKTLYQLFQLFSSQSSFFV